MADVEGMGAREQTAEDFYESHPELEALYWPDPDRWWNREVFAFAEAFHKQARSLRGATEQDDSWARRAIEEIASTTAPGDWVWCPEESLDKNAAVILKHAPADLRGAGGQEPLMRELSVAHNILRTKFGRKCDIHREDGKCSICRDIEARNV